MKTKTFGDGSQQFSVAPVTGSSTKVAVWDANQVCRSAHMSTDEAERFALRILKAVKSVRKGKVRYNG